MCSKLFMAAGIALAASCASMNTIETTQLPPIPDAAYAKGVSAPFCGVIGETLVVAGGANFPGKSLLEGGAKRVYADIWAFSDGRWSHAGVLPDSTAYGATFQVPGGLVFAGGNICGSTTDKVYKVSLSDGNAIVTPLPALPVPMEQCGWSSNEGILFLAGREGVFCCREGEYVWKKLADIPEPLLQPVAFASGGKLFLWGGFNPQTLLAPPDGHCLNLETLGWESAPAVPDGGTFVGATGATLPDGRLAVVGGVNRAIFERALRNTPEDRIPYLSKEPAEYKFRSEVFVFGSQKLEWSSLGTCPETALAGPGVAASPDGGLFVAGGELKPGVRSPMILNIFIK
ncbi:MAG: hypothetical protein IJV32_02500 [Bacteroidales bacterium]|nr:hypothetical protein [Bacteroidales bacterium]